MLQRSFHWNNDHGTAGPEDADSPPETVTERLAGARSIRDPVRSNEESTAATTNSSLEPQASLKLKAECLVPTAYVLSSTNYNNSPVMLVRPSNPSQGLSGQVMSAVSSHKLVAEAAASKLAREPLKLSPHFRPRVSSRFPV